MAVSGAGDNDRAAHAVFGRQPAQGVEPKKEPIYSLNSSDPFSSSSRVEVETDPFFPAAPKDSCTLAESTQLFRFPQPWFQPCQNFDDRRYSVTWIFCHHVVNDFNEAVIQVFPE
jgi:hypothetical protein